MAKTNKRRGSVAPTNRAVAVVRVSTGTQVEHAPVAADAHHRVDAKPPHTGADGVLNHRPVDALRIRRTEASTALRVDGIAHKRSARDAPKDRSCEPWAEVERVAAERLELTLYEHSSAVRTGIAWVTQAEHPTQF